MLKAMIRFCSCSDMNDSSTGSVWKLGKSILETILASALDNVKIAQVREHNIEFMLTAKFILIAL